MALRELNISDWGRTRVSLGDRGIFIPEEGVVRARAAFSPAKQPRQGALGSRGTEVCSQRSKD